MTISTGILLLIPWLASSVSPQQSRESLPTVVIQGGILIDVHTGHQVTDSLIVIEGNRIKQVGREPDVAVPRDAQVINAQGKWIIPGLMDMHAHITGAKNLS